MFQLLYEPTGNWNSQINLHYWKIELKLLCPKNDEKESLLEYFKNDDCLGLKIFNTLCFRKKTSALMGLLFSLRTELQTIIMTIF